MNFTSDFLAERVQDSAARFKPARTTTTVTTTTETATTTTTTTSTAVGIL